MKTIAGISDWTLGASCAKHTQENEQELLEATLLVMHAYGSELKCVSWFGRGA